MDRLAELLRTPVYGRVDVARLLGFVVAVVVVRWVWRAVRPRPSIVATTTRPAACGCGWRGLASMHAPRCPRCGKPALFV